MIQLSDGDYLIIYDGPDLQSPPIAKLDQNFDSIQNIEKSISSTGTYMLVQFITDHEFTLYGFAAKIHHKTSNLICMAGMNITSGLLNSPNPSTVDCSWVITASLGSTISIQFHVFEV